MPHEEMMQAIYKNSRDNARTPMQWNANKNAVFSSGIPWISVNSNYLEVNVDHAIADKDSVLHHYKKLIA